MSTMTLNQASALINVERLNQFHRNSLRMAKESNLHAFFAAVRSRARLLDGSRADA